MLDAVRILLVDDEQMVRDNLEAYLEDEGLEVETAASAEQGLALLAQQTFEVAIVDMRLPGMSGNEFIRRALARGHRLNFLIHTGSLEYRLPSDLLSNGLNSRHVLHKPLADMNILTERLETLCGYSAETYCAT